MIDLSIAALGATVWILIAYAAASACYALPI